MENEYLTAEVKRLEKELAQKNEEVQHLLNVTSVLREQVGQLTSDLRQQPHFNRLPPEQERLVILAEQGWKSFAYSFTERSGE